MTDTVTDYQTEIEASLCQQGIPYCGVDEAGAGPLCGDVMAAAVILDPENPIEGLNDSKKLTEKKREKLFDEIREKALDYCIARATVEEIDQLNILHATMLAMTRAVDGLPVKPSKVLVDGNRCPHWPYNSEAIIKGDGLIAEISAASIIAKVVRDQEMEELDNFSLDMSSKMVLSENNNLKFELSKMKKESLRLRRKLEEYQTI